MTRDEFEALMDADGWSPEHRARWDRFTPSADATRFRSEMKRPDGLVEVVVKPRLHPLFRAFNRAFRKKVA